jgi:hypothetical protein
VPDVVQPPGEVRRGGHRLVRQRRVQVRVHRLEAGDVFGDAAQVDVAAEAAARVCRVLPGVNFVNQFQPEITDRM